MGGGTSAPDVVRAQINVVEGLLEVDPDAVDVERLAVPSGTGSNVAAEQCGPRRT